MASSVTFLESLEQLNFPNDFTPCTSPGFFQVGAVKLAKALLGKVLYSHPMKTALVITETEAYPESGEGAAIYNAYFGSECPQFQVGAGQLIARLPRVQQPLLTPEIAFESFHLELYITAGADANCGDVVLLKACLPLPNQNLKRLKGRVETDEDTQSEVIDAEHIGVAFGLGERGNRQFDWAANHFLYQSEGVQLFFLKARRRCTWNLLFQLCCPDFPVVDPRDLEDLVCPGLRNLDTRAPANTPGSEAYMNFTLNLQGNV